MALVFPTIVYRCPGPHQRPGGSFATKPVANELELEDALLSGWHSTLPRAIDEADSKGEGKECLATKDQAEKKPAPKKVAARKRSKTWAGPRSK